MQWINRPLLEQLLAAAVGNSYSSFYRDKYMHAGVEPKTVTIDSFFNLPLLTRQELIDTPVDRRLFVPKEEIRSVALTSGTTSGTPLIIPYARVQKYGVEPSLGYPTARPLVLHPQIQKGFPTVFVQMCQEARHPVVPVFGDLNNMANNVIISKMAGCDSLWALPTIASAFAPYAKAGGIAEHIKLIVFSAEALTGARRAELGAVFPNALMGSIYATTEIGQWILFTCPDIMKKGQNRFHIVTTDVAAMELIDDELVISFGNNKATPLLRYRTGDYFAEVPEGCSCDLPGPLLEWSHRSDVDRVRVNGMQFDVEESDRAFAVFPHLAGKEYQVHFYPIKGSTAVSIQVEVVDPVLSTDSERAHDLAAFIEREVPSVWRLSPTATMQTALAQGAVGTFKAIIVPVLSRGGVKVRRFITHAEQ